LQVFADRKSDFFVVLQQRGTNVAAVRIMFISSFRFVCKYPVIDLECYTHR